MCGITFYKGQYQPRATVAHRGPDTTLKLCMNDYTFIFHRLAINDTSYAGMQPFLIDGIYLMCNGEIYNHKELEKLYNIETKSNSDCEFMVHLYKQIGFKSLIEALDGVFAIILYDSIKDELYFARDPLGVRPLFYNMESFVFASEAKVLPNNMHTKPFPPNHIYDFKNNIWNKYYSPMNFAAVNTLELAETNVLAIQENIRNKFFHAVKKRIDNTDRPVGLLLSGGFDSSLVASIAKKLFPNKTFHTFSIGLKDSRDLVYARQMSQYIKSQHHEIIYTFEEAIQELPEIIKALETYDITTIRASTPMYLLSRYIRDKTNIKVLLSGEGSDEFGYYKYFQNAPSTADAANESRRLFETIHYFDVLRADRSTAAHGLELRVPFLDLEFFRYMHEIPAEFHRAAIIAPDKPIMIEKRHLRNTFKDYLPEEVLWRPKDAFSDSVGESWRMRLINFAESQISDEYYIDCMARFGNDELKPTSKEALFYRLHFNMNYLGCAQNLTPFYWMPKWVEEKVDPSATLL